MSDTPAPPAFKHAFKGGEMIPEAEYGRVMRYLPRQDGETHEAYAERAAKAGLGVVLRSEEARDLAHFKATVAEAAARGVPVLLLTAEASDHTDTRSDAERETAKADALKAARGQQ